MFDLLQNHGQSGCGCSGDEGKDPNVRKVGGNGIFMFAILSLIFVVDDSHINDLPGADKSLARPGRKQATATKL